MIEYIKVLITMFNQLNVKDIQHGQQVLDTLFKRQTEHPLKGHYEQLDEQLKGFFISRLIDHSRSNNTNIVMTSNHPILNFF